MLEPHHKKALKTLIKKQKIKYTKSRTDASAEEVKECEELLRELLSQKPNPYEDREQKIAEFKIKKSIMADLETLKTY
jgi:hypothetical protein